MAGSYTLVMPKKKPLSRFHVIKKDVIYELTPEPEGGYTISVVQLPGCISYGETIDDALAMIEDAMEGWLHVARKERLPIPAGFEDKIRPPSRAPTRSVRRKAS